MLKAGAFVAVLAAMVLCVTLSRIAAEEPHLRDPLAKGTKAVLLVLSKDQELPEGALRDTAVDIVGEISDPVETGIALLNVRLLEYDPKREGKEQGVVVQLTPAQVEVLVLMQKNGTKLGIKLHAKEKVMP